MATPVSLTDAETQTENWRDYIDPILGSDTIHAFFIPKDDLDAIMQQVQNGDGMRVYGALTTPNDITTMHLLIVAVDSNGDDVVSINQTSMVYNTTKPCPNMCGSPNILNS